MAYKHIEILGTYNVQGRGQVFLTLDRTVRAGEVIEVNGKTWKVKSVEVSDSQPHAGLVVAPFTESDAKQATAQDAKNILQAIFTPMLEAPEHGGDELPPAAELLLHNPVAGMIPPPLPKPQSPNNDEQKLKLVGVLNELNTHMVAVRDWALQRLAEFDLGKEPPAVLVMVVSMPRDGMSSYVQNLEPFLMQSMEALEKEGKLPWANVKAVAGCKQQ